jgi:glutamyl-tRNA(Gln) amidotransferase subunit E
LGVKGLTRQELEKIVDAVLEESTDLIGARKEGAEKTLMGRVMESVRGRADGKLVSEVLHERLADRLRDPKKREKKGKR